MKTITRRVVFLLIAITLVMGLVPDVIAAENFSTAILRDKEDDKRLENSLNAESIEELINMAARIIAWKKNSQGIDVTESLFNNEYGNSATTTAGDWYVIAFSRLGLKDNYNGYLQITASKIANAYGTNGTLSKIKATEYHRITLAILSCGGNPKKSARYESTNNQDTYIDLIADGVYDRQKVASLGKQGINGWIWGLIALDSMNYEIQNNSGYTREDIIEEIIKRMLPDGGFSLSGTTADVDITAMAIIALSKYYNTTDTYQYENQETKEITTLSVKDVIDKSISLLSSKQLEDGDYESFNTVNIESTCQVIMALCTMGVDPLQDERFIKNGHNLLDGLKKYVMEDGGVAHTLNITEDNGYTLSSNSMAGEQTLLAIAAMLRYYNHMNTIYDFTEEAASLCDIYPKLDDLSSNNVKDIEILLQQVDDETDKIQNTINKTTIRKRILSVTVVSIIALCIGALIVRYKKRKKRDIIDED